MQSDENPIKNIEKQLEAALDELVSTRVLQASNRMDIDTLLNPADKSMDEATDKEIYQAVMVARQAQEDASINGGDDDVDDDAFIDDCPTHREVLQATSLISRYLDGLHNPVAQKLETLLGTFGHQMRLDETQSLVSTHITDYFSHD
jgi:hypothetical protein